MHSSSLDLDADIHEYVPSFPDKGVLITSGELAGHLAGIRHYRNEYMNAQHFANITDSLKRFENDPLVSQPGSLLTNTLGPDMFSVHRGRAYLALGRVLQAGGKNAEAHSAFVSAEEQFEKSVGADESETRTARQLSERHPI